MSEFFDSPTCGKTEILMTLREPGYILDLVPDDGTLVEWGCGGSTIYFLDNLKPNQILVSIEHNNDWYNKIKDKLANHPNIDRHVFLYIPSTVANPYYARPEEESPCGLVDYINPSEDIISNADVFLVDGIARGPIAAFLSVKAKPSAQVIIHDYLGREEWYDWAVACFKNKEQPIDTVLVHLSNEEWLTFIR